MSHTPPPDGSPAAGCMLGLALSIAIWGVVILVAAVATGWRP